MRIKPQDYTRSRPNCQVRATMRCLATLLWAKRPRAVLRILTLSAKI